MTYMSQAPLGEAVQEFLRSSWPSTDRFDEWVAYLIPYSKDGAVIAALDTVLP